MTRRAAPPARAGARPVCMITHSYYEEDPRVRREAEAVAASGRPVDVLALRRPLAATASASRRTRGSSS